MLELGPSAFLCVPGELGVEIGLRLKKEFRARYGLRAAGILGLANDHLGYFLTEEQYDVSETSYERKVSFYGPKMDRFIVDRLLEIGDGMWNHSERGSDAKDRAGQPKGRGR